MTLNKTSYSHRAYFLGCLGLLLLVLLMFGDLIWGTSTLVLSSPDADLVIHFASWRKFAFDELRQGHLVLWNPHYLCGAPFLGNFESALLYPPNWLYLVLPLVSAINFGIVLHVFLAGLFTYLWAFSRRLHPLACLLAGTVFMFGGSYFLHLYAGHIPNLCAMVWAPLIFLAIDRWLGTRKLRWALFGIFPVSMQILAGHPQYFYFTTILAGLYSFLRLLQSPKKIVPGIGIMSMYLGATLLTAVQFGTGLQAFKESARSFPMSPRIAGSFSFPPENILTLALPEIFGNLREVHYWGRWFLWEVSIFIGFSSFFLVLYAVGEVDKKNRGYLFAMAVLAFLLSLGSYFPFSSFFYFRDFGSQGLRGSCKFNFLASLFLAMLAGFGIDQMLRTKKIQKWFSKWLLSAGFFLATLGILVFYSASQGLEGAWWKWFTTIYWLQKQLTVLSAGAERYFVMDSGFHAAKSLLVGGGTCGLLALTAWMRRWTTKAAYGIVFLTILELFAFARMNRPTFDLAVLNKRIGQERQFYADHPGDFRVYGTKSDALSANGYDIWEDEPMVPIRYARFICQSQGLPESEFFGVDPPFKKFSSIMSLVRLRYLIHPADGSGSPGLQVYELPFKPMVRAQLLDHWWVPQDPDRLFQDLLNPAFDPRKEVLLEKDPFPRLSSGLGKGSVSYRDLSTDEMEIKAETTHSSVLLVTDNYSSGWKASALPDSDQQSYQVMPGDYFLRAIPLEAGKHHFRLKYDPPVFEIGKWVSLAALLVYLFLVLLAIRKPKIGPFLV